MEFLIWLAAVVMTVFIGGYLCMIADEEKMFGRGNHAALIIFIFLLIMVVFSPMYIEYPSDTPIFTLENGRLVSHRGGFHIPFNKHFIRIPIGLVHRVSSHLEPITSNPKLRRLHYSVNFTIIDPEKFLASVGTPPHSNAVALEKAEAFVRFQLYELNELHSTELAGFYNPLDEQQQAYFSAFVTNNLNEMLNPMGIQVTGASFLLDRR